MGLDQAECTFAAVSDLLDVDLAVENVELGSKTVFKSAHSLKLEDGTKKAYRPRALIR